MLCFSKEALSSPLTTLPSQALQTEAVKLFKVRAHRNTHSGDIVWENHPFEPCAACLNVTL